jgi:hypothetical protein
VTSGFDKDALEVHLECLRIRGEAQGFGFTDGAGLPEAIEILVE